VSTTLAPRAWSASIHARLALGRGSRCAATSSQLRYRGGLDSYLQVLDAETRLFAGQLQLAELKRDELIAIVTLYRALGGGWQGVATAN
jgi:outer membrane protein TolC